MNRLMFTICMIMLFISVGFSFTGQGDNYNSKAKKTDRKTIAVVGDMNYPPYEYIKEDGSYTGFNVDIVKKISQVKGFHIEIIPMTWEKAVKSLENRQVNIIQGMIPSGDRSKKFIFSKPILENDYVIFTLKNNNIIESVIDLKGRKVSYQLSDLAEEVLSSVDAIRIGKENQRDAIQLLLDKKVDAFVGNKLTGMYYLQKINSLNKVKVQGSPLLKNNYSIAANQEDKEIIDTINEGIEELKESGEYEKIYDKWFGSLFEEDSGILRIALGILFVVFVITMIVIFIVAFYNEKLRKKFDKIVCEKDEIAEALDRYQEELLSTRMIIDNLIDNSDFGILIFDTNGILRKYNTITKQVIKESIRVGDTWESLNLVDIMGMDLEDSVGLDSFSKEVKMLVNNHVCLFNINMMTIRNVEKNENLGWMLQIKKLS
ncbi:transporter substrate-binding domain-containing protein [Clostridium cylindrosporum]|nr:transporter substrate-binding domain-containing protein [Clostridium cylindrosporum]